MKARRKLVRKPKVVRPEPTRDETRRFASRASLGLAALGAMIGLVVLANRWVAREEVRRIRIVGRSILDSAEIATSAAIPDGASLQRLDLDALERRLTAHPFIARAAAYRGENGTLVIEITERAPVAMTFLSGAPQYLDSAGVRLPYRFSSAGFDVPVLTGVMLPASASNGVPGNGASGAASGNGALDSMKVREALAVADTIRSFDEGLYRQISEIRREPSGEYTLVTADGGVPIRAGAPAGLAGRLGKLGLFLATAFNAEGPSKASYIDLRWENDVVVRWRGELRGAAAVKSDGAGSGNASSASPSSTGASSTGASSRGASAADGDDGDGAAGAGVSSGPPHAGAATPKSRSGVRPDARTEAVPPGRRQVKKSQT